jgi:hypothetical protein
MEVITMKISPSKVAQIFLLTALLIIGGVMTSSNAEARSLEFVNYSGATIDYLYISDASAYGWGSDLLGNRSLGHNETHVLNLPSNAPRYIKMKIVFRSGRDVHWDSIDLSSLWRITFVNNNGVIRANWN